MAVSWWCGGYREDTKERFGVATRYGYIVIVPKWYEAGLSCNTTTQVANTIECCAVCAMLTVV